MTKRLIVNADGFGFTPGVNRGIRDAVRDGIVTSISCNANFPFIDELPELMREFPQLSPGVHLNLSVGRPISPPSDVPSLVNAEGCLHGPDFVRRLMTGRIRLSEMERELDAQIGRMLDLGVTPSHWDGHQNKHLYPPFFWTAMRVAKRRGVVRLRSHRRYLFMQDGAARRRRIAAYYARNPYRLATHAWGRLTALIARLRGFKTPDRLISPAYLDHSAKYLTGTWVALMCELPEGTSEIYCHPGYPDDILRAHAVYVDQRKEEVAVLTSPEVRSAVRDSGVDLVSFYDL